MYFKINSIKSGGKITNKPCYVFRDESMVIQEGTIHEYLPPIYKLSIPVLETSTIENEIEINNISNFPLSLHKPLEELKMLILPFITTGKVKKKLLILFHIHKFVLIKYYLLQIIG